MASGNHLEFRGAGGEIPSPEIEIGIEDEDLDLEPLESEIKLMTEKIFEYRAKLPDQLMSTLLYALSAKRPIIPELKTSLDLESSGKHNLDTEAHIVSCGGALPAMDKAGDKVRLLQEIIARNSSTMPVVIKRIKEQIAAIESLNSTVGITLHPAFKKKRTQ